jgi:hypothetical protein
MIRLTMDGATLTTAQRRLLNTVPNLQAELLRQVANTAFAEAQTAADTHTITGNLVRSIEIIRSGDGYIVQCNERLAEYAPFVHWGTRPHPITPNAPRRRLRWAAPYARQPGRSGESGFFTFARSVRHPGYRGDPFMQTALDRAVEQFDRLLELSRLAIRHR